MERYNVKMLSLSSYLSKKVRWAEYEIMLAMRKIISWMKL